MGASTVAGESLTGPIEKLVGKGCMRLRLLNFNGCGTETEPGSRPSLWFEEKDVMKPVQIGLLVVAGAIGGALVMKVTQKTPEQPKAVPVAAVQTPAPAPTGPAPAVQPPPVETAKPSPVETAKPSPVEHVAKHRHIVSTHKPDPEPPVVARNEPTRQALPAPAPQPVEQPAPVAPPARPEPEVVAPAPPPPPPAPQVTLNAGLTIPVRLIDGLSSERNMPGDKFTGSLDQPLVVDGFVIAERGARVEGRVVASDRGGKVKGVAALAVELTRLHTSDGQTVAIQTDSFERHAAQTHTQDAEKVGAGAALGAIIGAIAGGGKGAAIGAGVGGGAGAGDVMLTRGKPATIPSETRINFRLRAPITLTEHR
jgi:hypothetical protein